MFVARKLFRKKAVVGSPLSEVSHSFDGASGVIVGTSWGGTVSWTGGVAPFTVALLHNGVVQYSTSTSSSSSTLRGAAMEAWNGGTMTFRVTDSLGATFTTTGQAISIYWISGGTVSVSSTTPPYGTVVGLSITGLSGNPATYTYAWQYQYKPPGGSFGSWTSFSGNSPTPTSGGLGATGAEWYFRCTASNAAGSVVRTSPLVTVGA